MTDIEQTLLWNEYKLLIEMWKFYLDRLIQTNVVYYTITGTVSGIFWKANDKRKLKNILMIPIVMGIIQILLMCLWAFPLYEFLSNIKQFKVILKLQYTFNPIVLITSAAGSTIGWGISVYFLFRRWRLTI